MIAVDYDAAAVCSRAQPLPPGAGPGGQSSLPLGDAAVDVVVNFRVIEHLWDQPQFITECLRVLRPGGLLLISTPNRITFTPGSDTLVNPFHTRELNAAELAELLTGAGFRIDGLYGVFHGPQLLHGHRARRLDHRRPDRPGARRRPMAMSWRPTSPRCEPRTSTCCAPTRDIDDSLDLVAIAVHP